MKTVTLAQMINQSCDVFNYAPKPEQLANITKAFSVALGDRPVEKITAAFQKHMMNASTFPTPADILDILTGRNEPTKFNYGQVTRCTQEEAEEYRRKREALKVSWGGKLYSQLTETEKAAAVNHVRAMEPEKAEEYKKYLRKMAGYPEEFFSRLRVYKEPTDDPIDSVSEPIEDQESEL